MLDGWIAAFQRTGGHALELRDAFVRHVRRVTRRYPDAYFVLGARSDEAMEDLADRSFTVCARVPKGRFPFLARTPFDAFVVERFDDRTIRYHSFDARLSITRELLREDYAHNLRRDPVLRWKDEVHRALGRALPEVATPDGRLWSVPATGPRVVRAPDAIAAALRRHHRADALPDLARAALTLAGQPMSHSQLTNLLTTVLEPPPGGLDAPTATPAADADEATVRTAVLDAWSDLDADARGVLAGLCRGDDYDTLIARYPSLRSRSGVSRAVRRISEGFLARVGAAVGGLPTELATTPKGFIDAILDVLLPLLDDLETPA